MIKPGSLFLTATFIGSIVLSTVLSSKLTTMGGFTFSIGLFFFPLTFIANEIGAEVYGKAFSKTLIVAGIFIQLIMLAMIEWGRLMPASPLRDITSSYNDMFAFAPRMILASITAYAFSQVVDVESFLKMKAATQGRFLWLRSAVAILISQAVDTAIFSSVFMLGVIPFAILVKGACLAYTIKFLVGMLDTPLLYAGVALIKWLDHRAHTPTLEVVPVQTSIFKKNQNLVDFILKSVPDTLIREEMVIAITSKIVSLSENAIMTRDGALKKDIVMAEADEYLSETVHGVHLTVKHGILIASAGIDESNSEDDAYILFPKDPYLSAELLWKALRDAWGIKKLGVIITDSHTQPLRKGVTGIGLSHFGFKATRNLVGRSDLFGREIKMTHVNVLDALANACVYAMGEVDECYPIAVAYTGEVEFTAETSKKEIQIPLDEDLYGCLFRNPVIESSKYEPESQSFSRNH